MLFRVCLKAGAVDHGEVGHEILQGLSVRAAQQMADEQAMPSHLCHHAHLDRMCRVGPAGQILHVIVTPLHVRDHVIIERIKSFGRHFGIIVPPDRVGHAVGFDHMFVFWRPAGKFTRRYQKRTPQAQLPFTVSKCGFDQRRLDQVVVDISQPSDALIFKLEFRVYPSKCHECVLLYA